MAFPEEPIQQGDTFEQQTYQKMNSMIYIGIVRSRSDYYPSLSPYSRCAGDLVNLVYPDGMDRYKSKEYQFYIWSTFNGASK